MEVSVARSEPASTASRVVPFGSLPGPRAWPLVGNLLQIDPKAMHTRLEDWAGRYGPTYRVQLGTREALVVSRADLIAGLLRDRPTGWRRLRSMEGVIREMGGQGVFSAEGDDWRRQRKLVMSAFDPAHLRRYFDSLVRVTERFEAQLAIAAERNEAIDLQTVLMRYAVDVTAGLAFGIDMNTLEHPDTELQGHLDPIFPMLQKRLLAPFPWWRHVRLPSDRAFEKHLAKVHEAIAGFIDAARARIAHEPGLRERPGNLLEALIVARDDAGSGLTEEELVGNVLSTLLAGEDTTANTLAWTLSLLACNRSAWETLVHDVDAALGDADMPRDFAVARGLEGIEHCVSESMRLHPVAPVQFVQNNVATVLGGVALPRDTFVICLTRPDAVSTRTAPDAAEFLPQRWRAGAGTAPDAASRDLTKASMPFGAGPRLCPGRYLAMLEMKMVLATIARNFELVEVRTDSGAPPPEQLAFTMFPSGLRMRLRARRG